MPLFPYARVRVIVNGRGRHILGRGVPRMQLDLVFERVEV